MAYEKTVIKKIMKPFTIPFTDMTFSKTEIYIGSYEIVTD